MERVRKVVLSIVVLILFIAAWADSFHLVYHLESGEYSIPIDSIDSLTVGKGSTIFTYLKDSTLIVFNAVDSVTIRETVSDTLYIMYDGDKTKIKNPRADVAHVCLNDSNADILIQIDGKTIHPIISISGQSTDGRLCVDSEVEYTLVLNGVNLSSSHAPAVNSMSKQKTTVVIEEGTSNTLSDGSQYIFDDTLEVANGCFSTQGALTIKGKGQLTVNGNKKHAIYAKKSITVKDGTLVVPHALSDAIHSGKNVNIEGGNVQLLGMQGDGIDLDDDFTMSGGSITMNIEGEAAKGIKCGKLMTIEGGSINANASGPFKNKDGDFSYCTILKGDSSMVISGGDFKLVNSSSGGKCISAAYNLTVSGGTFYLETTGDGAEYTNSNGETDYYTSKCISADDTLTITRGGIKCLSTGIGGKGVVGGRHLQIGLPTDTAYQQGPSIEAETTNSSIVDDVYKDERYGCPKAIKAGEYLYIYSGDILCTTSGMGGEGIECGKEMYFHNGNLECNCYDDGINIGEKLEVFGGQIYCNSKDNDGIDSNGSIYIRGGIVTSINQRIPNESFDTERRQLYLLGGIVVGIGSSKVKIAETAYPFYNTLFNNDPEKPISRGLRLTSGKYLNVAFGDQLLVSLKNENLEPQSFVTIMLPYFVDSQMYTLYESDRPTNTIDAYFHDKFFQGGSIQDARFVENIFPTREIE